MSSAVVFMIYGCAAFLALGLLYFFRATHWYLHALSLAVALIAGLMPIPEVWHVPAIELMIGAIFLFFFLWGICAPLFPRHHDHHHPKAHHA